jgi:hypothetical protein
MKPAIQAFTHRSSVFFINDWRFLYGILTAPNCEYGPTHLKMFN